MGLVSYWPTTNRAPASRRPVHPPALPPQARHLSQEQYAQNHPAGRIGRRLMLRVADVMLHGEDLPLVTQGMLMADVLMELTSKG